MWHTQIRKTAQPHPSAVGLLCSIWAAVSQALPHINCFLPTAPPVVTLPRSIWSNRPFAQTVLNSKSSHRIQTVISSLSSRSNGKDDLDTGSSPMFLVRNGLLNAVLLHLRSPFCHCLFKMWVRCRVSCRLFHNFFANIFSPGMRINVIIRLFFCFSSALGGSGQSRFI
jgi:hypothetical protein